MKSSAQVIKRLSINLFVLFVFGIVACYIGPDHHIFIKIFIGFTLAAIILGDYLICAFNEFFKWIDNMFGIWAQYSEAQLDLIYCTATDFESKEIQKWLRELLRDVILNTAKQILSQKVKCGENLKGLKGSGVTIRRLRKNILGQCSHSNHITLQPFPDFVT